MEAEIDVFIQCIENYFSKRSNEKVIIETPYLTDDVNQILSDFTGMIMISGTYHGCIYFTAPTDLLRKMIVAHGQDDFDPHFLEDTIGEITNTLSGNSRKSLGSKFVISIPKVVQGNTHTLKLTDGAHSYVVPLKWSGHSAAMVVSIVNN